MMKRPLISDCKTLLFRTLRGECPKAGKLLKLVLPRSPYIDFE